MASGQPGRRHREGQRVSERPYNPLDTKNLGTSVAEALLERTPRPIGDLTPFDGAGIYAIYYVGPEQVYAPIAEANRDGKWRWPIYIGKAVPSGRARRCRRLVEGAGFSIA
jgi:hypothetical protein